MMSDEDDKAKIKLNGILHPNCIIGNVAELNGSPFCSLKNFHV